MSKTWDYADVFVPQQSFLCSDSFLRRRKILYKADFVDVRRELRKVYRVMILSFLWGEGFF